VAVTWVFRCDHPPEPRPFSLFGVEIVFKDAELAAIACLQYGERLADVEKVHSLLNTEPTVGLQLHDEAVQWLKGWAMALQNEAVKLKAVEKARRVKHCRI
jgi:hypothetical protein